MSIVWPLGQGTPSNAAIERVTAPVATPISLAEAKLQARVDHDDDDALIQSLIGAAVDLLDGDGHLGRAMITQTWAQWVSQSPGSVTLRIGPFIAVTALQYYDAAGVLQDGDETILEVRKSGDFVTVEPKDGLSWPGAQSRPDAIKITYTAGFGAAPENVPQGIRHAMLMLVAHWYRIREAAAEKSMSDVPMAVDALINRHRVGWYG